MRVTVFTTVLGDTDPLRPPTVIHAAARYVVFADQPTDVPPYAWIPTPIDPDCGPCLQSRRLKILANDPALGAPDVVLWHDAAFQLGCDPLKLAARLVADDCDLLAFRHPKRNQIEDEAQAIAELGYMPADVLAAQVDAYRALGFTQTAITSTGFSLRRRTPLVRAFEATWWGEVARWGYRDQMSVDFALWCHDIRPAYLPGHYRDNPHARWYPEGSDARLGRHAHVRSADRAGARGTVDAGADAAARRMDSRRWRHGAGHSAVRPGASVRAAHAGRGELRGEPVARDGGGER